MTPERVLLRGVGWGGVEEDSGRSERQGDEAPEEGKRKDDS